MQPGDALSLAHPNQRVNPLFGVLSEAPWPLVFSSLALPVALPLTAYRMGHGGARRDQELLAVRNAAVVFPPSHFLRVGLKVGPGDMMVRPDLRATKSHHHQEDRKFDVGLSHYMR